LGPITHIKKLPICLCYSFLPKQFEVQKLAPCRGQLKNRLPLQSGVARRDPEEARSQDKPRMCLSQIWRTPLHQLKDHLLWARTHNIQQSDTLSMRPRGPVYPTRQVGRASLGSRIGSVRRGSSKLLHLYT